MVIILYTQVSGPRAAGLPHIWHSGLKRLLIVVNLNQFLLKNIVWLLQLTLIASFFLPPDLVFRARLGARPSGWTRKRPSRPSSSWTAARRSTAVTRPPSSLSTRGTRPKRIRSRSCCTSPSQTAGCTQARRPCPRWPATSRRRAASAAPTPSTC